MNQYPSCPIYSVIWVYPGLGIRSGLFTPTAQQVIPSHLASSAGHKPLCVKSEGVCWVIDRYFAPPCYDTEPAKYVKNCKEDVALRGRESESEYIVKKKTRRKNNTEDVQDHTENPAYNSGNVSYK